MKLLFDHINNCIIPISDGTPSQGTLELQKLFANHPEIRIVTDAKTAADLLNEGLKVKLTPNQKLLLKVNLTSSTIKGKYDRQTSNTKINMNNYYYTDYTDLEKLYLVIIMLQLVLIRNGN
jgi:hypothetical protein